MSFLKAVTTVGGSTLFSRILGLVRDILTAVFLGATPVADAFFVAYKLPNLFRRITGEGAFSFAFVPMFSRMLDDKDHAKHFAEEAQAVMLAFLLPFTILVMIFMPYILHVVAPGIANDPARAGYAAEFGLITFPFILLVSLTALLGGVMNSLNKFAAFALAPVVMNVVMITFLILSNFCFPSAAHAMSWGVLTSGVIQLAWMMWHCHRSGFFLKLRRPRLTPEIKKMFNLMGPGIVGAIAAQINMFSDMFLSSMLPLGSISYLYYAGRLHEFPLGVIGVAIGTALLPMLSKAIKANDGSEKELLANAFEISLILALPAAIGLMILAEPIITAIFERGLFTHTDTIKSATALMAYSFGIPAFILARTFSTSFYAREDTKTPVKIAISCAVINIGLSIFLIFPFKHVGISMATAASSCVNASWLWYDLRKRGFMELPDDVFKRINKILVAGGIMATVLYAAYYGLNHAYEITSKFAIITELTGLIVFSAIVYFASLYFLGIFNIQSLRRLFKGR